MPRGDSGRIVIELDPALKRRLYSALALESLTLKDWFVDSAKRYVAEHDRPSFPDTTPRKKRG